MINKKIFLISSIFIFSCSPSKVNDTNLAVLPVEKPNNNSTVNTPKTDISPIKNEVKPVITESPAIVIPSSIVQQVNEVLKINISNISLKEGNSGSLVKLSGKNFSALKLKDIVFVNSAGIEVKASISNISDTEVQFLVPDNTFTGLSSLDLSNGYHSPKIFLILANGEKIQTDSFKVFFKPVSSNIVSNSSSSSSGNSNTFVSNPTVSVSLNLNEPKAAGNVAVSLNLNEPTKSP